MARIIAVVVFLVLALNVCCFGNEYLSLGVFGNNDVFGVELAYRTTERASIGLEGAYFDALKPETGKPAFTAKAVGKYYYALDTDVNLYLFSVKASSFAGLGLGARFERGEEADDVADIRTGIEFGEGRIRYGFTYLYNMTDLMWRGDTNADHMVLGSLNILF